MSALAQVRPIFRLRAAIEGSQLNADRSIWGGDMGQMHSVRMRASRQEEHVSGAERICAAGEIAAIAQAMIKRATNHSLGMPDRLHITVEALSGTSLGCLLPIITFRVANQAAGRQLAIEALVSAGVSECAAAQAVELVRLGPGPNNRNMRGAMIVCAKTGQRLERDAARGVRATRLDVVDQVRCHLQNVLPSLGAQPERTTEALTIASKMLQVPHVLAEYCCSDDGDYAGGYIASPLAGYMRINKLKAQGHPKGGRAIFVSSSCDVPALVSHLEESPVLFNRFPGLSKVHTLSDARCHLARPDATRLTQAFHEPV